MRDLSIVIPARNEQFLTNTIDSILSAITADTEIIAICDGSLPLFPVADHPRVKLVLLPKSIGQREATNMGVRLSRARYVAKVDAHCSFSPGFDAALIQDCQPDWVLCPVQYNLHCFDWGCKNCGYRTYQGPDLTTCIKCGESKGFEKIMVWQPRLNRRTESWAVDASLHFQYFREYNKRPEGKTDIHDTFSLLGAFFFMERKLFWEFGGLDSRSPGWGQYGLEIAAKAWTSNRRVAVTRSCWYSHAFRTQGGSWGFPYPMKASDQEKARAHSRWLWQEGNWEGMQRPFSSVVEQFLPCLDWTPEAVDNLKKIESKKKSVSVLIEAPKVKAPAVIQPAREAGIIYYTDVLLQEPILEACQHQLLRAANGHRIVSVSLGKAIDFGDERVIIERQRGAKTLFIQLIAGLERSTADYVFFCEHDCLYPPEHFTFIPPRDDTFYYNVSLVRVSAATGKAITYQSKQLSGLCANRLLLLEHYYRRLAKMARTVREVAAEGRPLPEKWPDGHSRFSGWEPGANARPGHEIDSYGSDTWQSSVPYIDIREHGTNFSRTKWRLSQFWDKSTCIGWRVLAPGELIPGWPTSPAGRFNEFLAELANVTSDEK